MAYFVTLECNYTFDKELRIIWRPEWLRLVSLNDTSTNIKATYLSATISPRLYSRFTTIDHRSNSTISCVVEVSGFSVG